MMLTSLPEIGFSKATVHSWSTFEANLEKTPHANKYLQEAVKGWISSPRIENPLARFRGSVHSSRVGFIRWSDSLLPSKLNLAKRTWPL